MSPYDSGPKYLTIVVFVALCMLYFCAGISWSKTLYISDQLIISLRKLPIDDSEVIKYLRSDTAVEYIDEANGYFQVRADDQAVGFIKKNYLTETFPNSSIVQQLRQENKSLQAEIAALEQKISRLRQAEQNAELFQNRIRAIETEKTELIQSFENLKQNAKHVDEIAAERNRLMRENEIFSRQLTSLAVASDEVFLNQAISWFLAGAGVLIFGWLLGRRSRKRYRFIG